MNIQTLNALVEALKGGIPINKVLVSETRKDRKVALVLDLCRKRKVPVQRVPRETIERKGGEENQGVFAEVSPVVFCSLDEILKKGKSGLLLILAGITDTGNMGAVIRSGVAAGVDGIIVSQRNSAPMNETVLKTSAGTLLKARIHQAGNLVQVVNQLKKDGFWIVGADMGGDLPYYGYDFTYKTAIVMGSEEKGISSLLRKNMDHVIAIPHSSEVESLNVSAAASVLLFEALRQKAAGKK
ncbi:MAG: 23S rRNA (guanosine(2251)-2'-O)-methyltransferase RlmB [bacterium]|nr:23S rRNA (guanosine(2251)-2'-O)-methyltransferase RlmB [bacterium]